MIASVKVLVVGSEIPKRPDRRIPHQRALGRPAVSSYAATTGIVESIAMPRLLKTLGTKYLNHLDRFGGLDSAGLLWWAGVELWSLLGPDPSWSAGLLIGRQLDSLHVGSLLLRSTCLMVDHRIGAIPIAVPFKECVSPPSTSPHQLTENCFSAYRRPRGKQSSGSKEFATTKSICGRLDAEFCG